MKSYEFTVYGEPKPKGRVKFNTKTGVAYSDAKTVQYENLVRMTFVDKFGKPTPTENPVGIVIRAYFPVPISWSRKKRQQALNGEIMMTKRPDIDNIEKAIYDSLNGLVWSDDKQIVWKYADKQYAEVPCVTVAIYERSETNE